MKKILIIIMAVIAISPLFAQNNISEVLSAVEQNNTTLKALRETANSNKLGNKTGIFLSAPEIGFNYLWGNPSSIGSRKDINIKQSFDIATISGMKNRLADQQNDRVEWQYQADRMNILLEAKQYLLDLIYYNGLLKELMIRKSHAESIASSQKKRLDKGEGNVLEYNNVRLNLSKIEAEIQRIETERNATASQLTRLNGGVIVSVENDDFESLSLPTDFNSWYSVAESKNPVLAYVKSDIELNKKQLSLNKAMNLPSFSIGYMSEKTMGQRYQGVSVGVSIPLWSNKNKVKQAKAAVVAAEARRADATTQFYNQLEILYQRAAGLQEAAKTYRRSLLDANNSQLLKKALDAGEISVLDYMIQAGLYYDSVDKALAAERDYQKAFAELSAVEL
ncbi:TolC family protein [Bacteroides helcogenes]|uniref:Outer membrane efflux protein n=1 Tax=Bacteroides helcogenes (strain ATCC 35417 / DSM 20613 / JCM 6297 / CCUG 15421 / P 36-108) TaxID=693979 RepID=E6SPZ2_BACT6|nr:TolC family protein [Bacteroides helcogenes]ADV42897.1 outer membrane efflux protein [Bacteroides helcogenes P 36-108]MDY5237058.1 TolC family protein [Bacteroides helcogenes]